MPVLTKQQLLDSLALLDTPLLQRLYNLSGYIITPEEDQLVNVTFEQIVNKAHSLADIYFPEWTDRSKADFGEFLVELYALFSEQRFWYINAFANEGFVQSASTYVNVYMHALRLGYLPNVLTSAEASFQVTFGSGIQKTFSPGELVLEVGQNGLKFSNKDSIILAASLSNITRNVTFVHGEYESYTSTFDGKYTLLTKKNIAVDSITQNIQSATWERVNSFSQSDSQSKHFIALVDYVDRILIEYGDNVYGQLPNVGDTIITTYRVGGGFIGNMTLVSAPAISISVNSSVRPMSNVTLLNDISGGHDCDTIDEVRLFASMFYRTQNGIINPYDCIAWLNAQPEIKKSNAYNWANSLYFLVIPKDGTHASTTLLNSLQVRVANRSIMGFVVSAIETTYISLSEITMTVYALQGYDFTLIGLAVKEVLNNYTNPLVDSNYGVGFIQADFLKNVVDSVEGVQNIVFETIDGVPATDILIAQNEILDLISDANIHITVSPTI